ncbi:hypothetical protein K2Y00_00120 [Patescibacteria group bacterium]|nr:hypothetical protein [Patescibacteria group bacterium]
MTPENNIPEDIKESARALSERLRSGDPTIRSITQPAGDDEARIVGKRPHTQLVIARWLKGIMNVSDIFRDERGMHWSSYMPLEQIAEPTGWAEQGADNLVLRYVFGDHDHNGSGNNQVQNRKGQRAVFDFEGAYGGFAAPYYKPLLLKELMEDLQSYQQNRHTVLLAFKKKLELLRDRFAGAEGRAFFKDVIASSGKDIRELFRPPLLRHMDADTPDNIIFEYTKNPESYLYEQLTARIDQLLAATDLCLQAP